MLLLIVALGVFPNIIFHVTDPAVTRTFADMAKAIGL
jgi:NADH:ubiquinone oxidoreductase subunit 4 (subunit M)